MSRCQDKLTEAYRLFERGHPIKKIVEEELKKFAGDSAGVPDNLEETIAEMLAKEPTLRWIDAVEMLATKGANGANHERAAGARLTNN